jgi:pimeloyl-ACP methyl ester carboxylesterase
MGLAAQCGGAGPGQRNGPDGLIDDDIAYVTPWGIDCTRIAQPVLLLHGGQDRIVPASHAAWLARRCPAATLWLQPEGGHLSVLDAAPRALEWLAARIAALPTL